jgi:NitT/TauT family transport system ATP-binding protein
MSKHAALDVRNLSFWYDLADLPVVYRCTFTVNPADFLAIIGPSGGGKSTLLRLISGLTQSLCRRFPDLRYEIRGSVTFGGDPLSGPHRSFAYVPQNYAASLLPSLSATDNILLAVKADGISSQERTRADELLSLCGISDVGHLTVFKLSSGQQQRVAICRALITAPKLLFMDEPFANLDPLLRPQMSQLLGQIRTVTGLSVVVVTHDMTGACALADRLLGVRPTYAYPQYVEWTRPFPCATEIERWMIGDDE